MPEDKRIAVLGPVPGAGTFTCEIWDHGNGIHSIRNWKGHDSKGGDVRQSWEGYSFYLTDDWESRTRRWPEYDRPVALMIHAYKQRGSRADAR